MVRPSTLPGLVLQTCSEDTTLGSAGATELPRPSDSRHLFWHYQFAATVRVTLEIHCPSWKLACEPFYACHRGHSTSAIWCCLFEMVALHSNWYLELLLAALSSWLADFVPCWGGALWLADSPPPALLCHLCVHRGLLCGDTMTHWIDSSWLAKLQLAQVPLSESWLCNLPSCGFVMHPPPYFLLHVWLLAANTALDCGRALSLLSLTLRLCQEAWEVFSDWCQSAEGKKYKAKGLSATKCKRLWFFNLVFSVYHLTCLGAVNILLTFVSTGPCILCFWEFSDRLLKSNIAPKTGLVNSSANGTTAMVG